MAIVRALFDATASWAERVRQRPPAPREPRTELRARLEALDLGVPRPLEELAAEVAALLEGGILHVGHPRFFGLFTPPAWAAGVVADALAAIYNPQVGAGWHSAAAVELERVTLGHVGRLLGLSGERPAATFTTGGSEANLTGLLAALARAFPSVVREGVGALPRRPVFYLSDQAHDSFVKAARVAGLGDAAARRVRSDAVRRMDVAELRAAIARDRAAGEAPILVVATAGTTATGAIDPLGEIADVCAAEGVWLHVDAAWGGIAALSPRLRPLLAGIERADSVTVDAHKILPIPNGAGMYFARDRGPTDAMFAIRPGYVPPPDLDEPDPYQSTLQWSRRFIGLKVYLTLAELGAAGAAAMVEAQVALGDELRRRLLARGWQVTADSPLPVVCFTDGAHDAASLARAVVADGSAWLSSVTLSGRPWLRACITNPRSRPEDLAALLAALDRARG